jgi:hypothetical protein
VFLSPRAEGIASDRIKSILVNTIAAKQNTDGGCNSLVYMQLFHTLARIFRSGSSTYELHDTTLRDVVAIHGLLFPLPPLDSKGVQVKIT